MELTNYSDMLTEMGKDVYRDNPFFRTLAEFMEHPMLRTFYDEYFTQQRVDSTLFFMWAYRRIEEQKPDLQPYEKLTVLNHIIHTKSLREQAFDEYRVYESIRHSDRITGNLAWKSSSS